MAVATYLSESVCSYVKYIELIFDDLWCISSQSSWIMFPIKSMYFRLKSKINLTNNKQYRTTD